jgi:hypothetical protein
MVLKPLGLQLICRHCRCDIDGRRGRESTAPRSQALERRFGRDCYWIVSLVVDKLISLTNK